MERERTNRANKVAKELTRWNDRYRFNQHRLPVPEPLSEPAEPSRAYRDFEWTVRHDWGFSDRDWIPSPACTQPPFFSCFQPSPLCQHH